LSLPIHCILSDGLSFEFFKFERTHGSRFLRGCIAGDPVHLRRGLHIRDFARTETSLPFILQLRPACETVFDTMLCAYISGLRAYHTSNVDGESQGPNFDEWDQALNSAEKALKIFREAESLRRNGDPGYADTSVQEALCALQERYYLQSSPYSILKSLLCLSTGCIPTIYKSDLIMTGWDDDQVRGMMSSAIQNCNTESIM
jgi:hypothetical protein